MSYKLKIDPKSMAAGRFIHHVYTALIRSGIAQQRRYGGGYSQQDIAQRLNVDKATISRLMRGTENITLRRLAEVGWALDLLPEITFRDLRAEHGARDNNVEMRTVSKSVKMRAPATGPMTGSAAQLPTIRWQDAA